MRRFKTIIKVIAAILVIILPFAAVPTVALTLPGQYGESFTSALCDKVDRLAEIDEPKIVIVGGSSVAFGLDSALIERYTGMPVVNFGVYAALGTKVMLDLSSDYINEGDVIILAPELDAQTLSMYFNASTTLQATDGRVDILSRVPGEHLFSLLGASWEFAANKIEYITTGTHPSTTGAYDPDNFNEYGDIVYERTENVMSLYCDPNTAVNLSSEILDPEFADYLNSYIKRAEKRGASVYFSWCPVNEMSITEDTKSDERIAEFESFMQENINCTFISSINDYILDAGYFYDTNFHLNDAGVMARTITLTRDILLELGIPSAVSEKIPEPPALPEIDLRYFGEDENAKYFEYVALESGAYMITGVKDEYKSLTTLTVPLGYNTYKVTHIAARAFEGTAVETLILTEDTNVRNIMNGAFKGASNLRSLYVLYPDSEAIAPPADFVGVASGFTVYVPESWLNCAMYYWGERGLKFEYLN